MKNTDNLQQINTNTPRETLVHAMGDLVVKTPVRGLLSPDAWLYKQQHAKYISNTLAENANPHYFVPRVLEIDTNTPRVIEQRAYGTPVSSDYFETLSKADQDIIYNAVANFMNDINQMYPVLTQAENFDSATSGNHEDDMTIAWVMDKLPKYIDKANLQIVRDAKSWFDETSKNDASVVFSHGDMNEHNIFYNPQTKTVSFIDFAEAKYQNITYMFEYDFSRLGWLDLDEIRKRYIALPRRQPVIIKSDPTVARMRNLLQNFTWNATEFLKNPKIATKIRIKMLMDDIANIQKLYESAKRQQTFVSGGNILSSDTKLQKTILPKPDPDNHR